MRFFQVIEVREADLEQIFKELESAKQTIRKCYDRLEELNVVTLVKEEAASGN